jgi:hypothetical protein
MLPVCNFSHLDLEIYCSSWSLESDGHIFVMSEREYSSIHFAAPLRRICATWQQKASSTFEAALAAKVLYFRFHRFFGGAELERRMGEKRQTRASEHFGCFRRAAVAISMQSAMRAI